MLPDSLPTAPDIERSVLAAVLFEPDLVSEMLEAGAEVFYTNLGSSE